MIDSTKLLCKTIKLYEKKFSKASEFLSLDFKDRMEYIKDLVGISTLSVKESELCSEEELRESIKIITDNVIPFVMYCLKIENIPNNRADLVDLYKKLYCLAGKRSLEHFILYYEWDNKDKLLETRYAILSGYVHYLGEIILQNGIETIVAQLPSGYGKSRTLKLAEAWSFGVRPSGTIIAICSSDPLIKSMSRSVIDIIKSPQFGEVFSNMDYAKDNKMFTKETDSEWKLKDCALVSSYLAVSRESNSVGLRASTIISIDDMYADFNEALAMDLNKRLWNKYITVYRERFVKGEKPKVVVAGTKWSPYDLISQIEEDLLKSKEFVPDEEYKYVLKSTDGTAVIIKVPAIDEETGESSCPRMISTEELLEKKDKIPTYLWECNYQQKSVPPEGLEFEYSLLKTYLDIIPPNVSEYCIATLDPARKGKNYVSMPVFSRYGENSEFALVDCLFKKEAMTELYDRIVDLVAKRKIMKLIIENNIDTSLGEVIKEKLRERGITYCEVVCIYSYKKKEDRIKDTQGVIKQSIIFPEKGLFPPSTQMGQFMEQLTTFSFTYPNKYDDAIDSVAMFTMYHIMDMGKSNRAIAIDRRALGI